MQICLNPYTHTLNWQTLHELFSTYNAFSTQWTRLYLFNQSKNWLETHFLLHSLILNLISFHPSNSYFLNGIKMGNILFDILILASSSYPPILTIHVGIPVVYLECVILYSRIRLRSNRSFNRLVCSSLCWIFIHCISKVEVTCYK